MVIENHTSNSPQQRISKLHHTQSKEETESQNTAITTKTANLYSSTWYEMGSLHLPQSTNKKSDQPL
jgi:hypothetical protein